MTQKYTQLKKLLRELFQLDQPDLDFGLYRIMHAKSDEVTQFLDKDLLPQVESAFAHYKTADKGQIEKDLARAIEQAHALGADPEALPKVRELRHRLQNEAVNLGQLENEVYDHLFSFFRRYYSEGDFLSKRVYKPGVYAIPYEGEEVTLHWANKDQYYIKTSEYLRDYAFRLRPEDEKSPMRVHFRLVDAAEGEHGNVKAAEGKDRVFILAKGATPADFIDEVPGPEGPELIIRFEYRPATVEDWSPGEPVSRLAGETGRRGDGETGRRGDGETGRRGDGKPPKQKDLIDIARQRILALPSSHSISQSGWVSELTKPHVTTSGEKADYSRLEAHLRRYTARNTFDYFIHKDLGGFLRRELDFYIKNEVMHLDDIENETAPRVEQYLSKIKVIRKIAGKIIDFLAQLEDFQKKLWLKKKFVVETHYCITVGSIPEEFYPEIAANEAQREEWVRLLAIDELKTTSGSLLEPERPGYSVPLTSDFLMRHPTLVVDTRLFDASLIERLLHTINNVSENTQGVLLHSENFQALSLVRARFSGAVPVVYIDPPYNTPYSQILYKNDYAHSSWLSLIANCLPVTADLWAPSFAFAIAIDDYEAVNLAILLDRYFPNLERSTVVVNHHPQGSGGRLSRTHEYLFLLSSKDAPKYLGEPLEDSDEDRNFMRSGTAENNYRHGRWKSFYALLVDPASRRIVDAEPPVPLNEALPSDATDDGLIRIFPINSRGEHRVWRSSYETGKARARAGELSLSVRGAVYQSIQHSEKRQTLFSNWIGPEFNAGTNGTGLIADLGFGGFFDYPKAMGTMEQCLWAASYGATDALVLDYFGGSGTTMHAVIRMNQKDGGERRFVLAEVGAHMDSVIIPRLKKTVFTPEWKDGKPKRLATPDEALRIPRVVKILRLESYEDALNNLETRRTGTQQSLLSSPEAQGPDGLKEQYLLRYMLNVETQGSQSLLNVQAFQDPTAYKLKVKRPGSDESREVNVDLLETFNWLIGLTVWHIAAPQTFSAAFERDTERRLRLKDRLRQEVDGPYWFRTVTGSTPDGRKALIIWRKLLSDPEQDNLVLDEWFTRQGYSSKDSEFDLIWVNGGNNLENLKTPDDRWKVRLIEEDFHRLMFDTEGA